MHLGGHELAGCHDHVLALLAGKVAVDISGIFEQVCGIALQILHLLQRLLELLCFLYHLQHKQKEKSIYNAALLWILCMQYDVVFGPYSGIFLQLAAVGGDGVDQALMYDGPGHFLPNQLPQDSRELFITNGHVWKINK